MTKIVLSVYNYFKRHRFVAWSICLVSAICFIASLSLMHFKEDISDFLPLDRETQTALTVYQDISGANRIYALVCAKDTLNADPELLSAGVEALVGEIEASDSLHYISSVVKEINLEKILGITDAVYDKIPYYLTEKDYARMDSLLSVPGYVDDQLSQDKQMLMFPSGNVSAISVSRDPLNLFAPVLNRVSGRESAIAYESYNGYILSPDMKKAIVMLESAFGANESDHNAELVAILQAVAKKVEAREKGLEIRYIGGPTIAVSNATQIKEDSILAVCIAGLLILALLIYVFRNARNIALIVVSVGWGWLFAMAAIGLLYSSVSIIVIGIASVILGIAVNYPLHLIGHLKDSHNPADAMKSIIAPLVVGNVTTVGAFLCLVPLNAPALHDLGLFASLLLVGTILFVLVFLPHFIKIKRQETHAAPKSTFVDRLASIKPENNKWLVVVVLLLTLVFGYFSTKTEFDVDMRNINYMTPEQRADLAYFQKLVSKAANTEKLYVVSSGETWDEALAQNSAIRSMVDNLETAGLATRQNRFSDFMVSKDGQKERLDRWHRFVALHKDMITDSLHTGALRHGFSPSAFVQFDDIVSGQYKPADFETFENLTSTVFMSNLSQDKAAQRKSVVEVLEVSPQDVDKIKDTIKGADGFAGLVFDVKSMNGAIAQSLSSDFNYIGIVCGCIVFVFLWLSLGSIELAVISFIPMAVSWIWILGIMGILGIKFNIVNVILATFIFGQGDDYTIFMTEGLSYELAYRKKQLASYKNSIVVSALIMFMGIGTLVLAKHPAMRSLGEVTVVGMVSVVLMAYLFPPLIFNWLVRSHGQLRQRPITLKKILCTAFCTTVFCVQLFIGYIIGFVLLVLTKPTAKKRLLLHRYVCSVFRWDVKRMPGIDYKYLNPNDEDFSVPAVIISNHQSLLDSFYLMTLTPRIVMIANDHVGRHMLTGRMFRWLGFITVGMGIDKMVEHVRPYVQQGYSVALYPEGERPTHVQNKVKRFRKGMLQMSKDLELDLLPVYLHGVDNILIKGSAVSNGGHVLMQVGKRIPWQSISEMGSSEREQAMAIRKQYQSVFTDISHEQTTVCACRDIVLDRYRYKGADIEHTARKVLKACSANHQSLEGKWDSETFMVVDEVGQGELALLLAVMYPDSTVLTYMPDLDARRILEGAMADFVSNIRFVDDRDIAESTAFVLSRGNDVIDTQVIRIAI